MAERLSDETITKALASLPEWERVGESLRLTVKMPTFRAALDTVLAVGNKAEEMKHHPDIDIRYKTLTFVLSTHDAGGITAKDVDLAGAIDRILEHPRTAP